MQKVLRHGYVCGTQWGCEMDDRGPAYTTIYNTLEALKRHEPCWPSCGIVRIPYGPLEDPDWVVEARPKWEGAGGNPVHLEGRKKLLLATTPLKPGDKINIWVNKRGGGASATVKRINKKLVASYRGKTVGRLLYGRDARKCWTFHEDK